jgi:hypothetical protein
MTIAAHSVVQASPRTKMFAGAFVILYAVITILPLLWIVATAFKSQSDAIAYPPKVIFQPTLEGYVNLFTVRTRQTREFIAGLPPATTWYDKLVRAHDIEGRAAVHQLAGDRLRLDLPRRAPGHAGRLRFFALSHSAGRRPSVLHSLDADDAAGRGRHPDLFDVPAAQSY